MLLNPGEVMLMPAAFPHGELGYGGETEFKQLAFMLMREKVVVHFGVAPNHGGVPRMAESFSWSMKRLPWYENMLEEVIAEVEEEGASSLGRDLLCGLVQLLLKEMIDGGQKRSWHPFVSTAINYFYHELSSHDLSVQSVAKVCGCSPDYLSRLFKRELGVSPQAFLQQRRIELAKNLLIQNSFNVSEVSRLCGFDRPAYFSTVFLSHVGVSPKAYQMKRSTTDAQCIKK
jgi:AraC-like DNA-binding protein